MAVYLRPVDGERVLLDTRKAKLVYEGREIDLTGATLDFYDFRWTVAPGTAGDPPTECKVLRVEDQFAGVAVEFPLSLETADGVAYGLADRQGDRRRGRALRRALPRAAS